MPAESPASASSSLALDVQAAAEALNSVASAGGNARIVVNKDGGASLVIQVNNENKTKIVKAQEAMKALSSNKTLQAKKKYEDNVRSNHSKLREEKLTPLMKASRGKDGEEVKEEIRKFGDDVTADEVNIKEDVIPFEAVDEDMFGNGKDSLGISNEDRDAKKMENGMAYLDIKSKDDEFQTSKNEQAVAAGKQLENTIKSNLADRLDGGWAAIHFAADVGNYEGMQYLLGAGADPNITERMGATPLHRAILAAGRYPTTQLRLANKNADISTMTSVASNEDGNVGAKMALPGVIRSKSDKNGKTASTPIDSSYLDGYMKCIKLLLDSDGFNLMLNERRDDKIRGESPSKSSTIGSATKGKPQLGNKDVLPKDDGYGISPLCLCVCQGYTARDALYPLLEHLLTRGFDPNAQMDGVSALHIALRNAHYGCAFALTRAGANINTVHPDDGKTAHATAGIIYGESFARELREASVVAMAVADPTRRRDLLRSQGEDGARKLAKRALNAGHSFIRASRWREAAGAYSEAAAYGPTALPERERFECLKNMSECFLQVERGLKSEEVARQLLKEFPKNPLAMISVGEALSHPSCGKLSTEQLSEVNRFADEALKLEKKSNGKEWWRQLETSNRSNSALLRALKLKGLVEGRTKEQCPAVKVANTALDEYFTVGGSIEKSAFAIELALKPELNHPSPLPLHGIRGFIYYSWASEILRANSLFRPDREKKDGLLRVMAPLKEKGSYKDAQVKIQVAFEEFEYYSRMNVNGEFPKLMYGFNIAKTLFALGRFKEGRRSALASIKERAEADLARLDDTGNRRRAPNEANNDDHFEGGSTQKLILQLNWALDMNRMLVTQMLVEWATKATSSSASLPSSHLLEPTIEGLSLKDDEIAMPHLKVILDKAITYKLLDPSSEKEVLRKISGDPIQINAMIRGLLCALKTLESGYREMSELRVDVGKIIMNFVSGAHRRQRQTKSSSRVVGSLLMEAKEWDKNVEIPSDLPKMYVKMAIDMNF
ncbi:hypothetical protein THAOC_34510 [Thalassiosira oceanica]|uniref:Uncharacterized protein n=1 Tax=Thalassiosira oceanica TaxID=159749 RepID=K0RCL2_THAOC|nr:hypothetical protein THAOC_34510 [Thalassiosira oceanica]|eukprot:EJK46806.1 hypothetical protein THAOC_34510 [Thalassiosira oceanica]